MTHPDRDTCLMRWLGFWKLPNYYWYRSNYPKEGAEVSFYDPFDFSYDPVAAEMLIQKLESLDLDWAVFRERALNERYYEAEINRWERRDGENICLGVAVGRSSNTYKDALANAVWAMERGEG